MVVALCGDLFDDALVRQSSPEELAPLIDVTPLRSPAPWLSRCLGRRWCWNNQRSSACSGGTLAR